MKIKESDGLPEENEALYDIGEVGRGKLSLCLGSGLKEAYKALKKKYGDPYAVYYDIFDNGKVLGWEWLFADGRKELGKIKRLLSSIK